MKTLLLTDPMPAGIRQMRAQMRFIVGLAGGVHHQKQMAAEIRHHQVVENSAAGHAGRLSLF